MEVVIVQMEQLLESLREQVNSLQERLYFCVIHHAIRGGFAGGGQRGKGKGAGKTQQISSKEQVQEGSAHPVAATHILARIG